MQTDIRQCFLKVEEEAGILSSEHPKLQVNIYAERCSPTTFELLSDKTGVLPFEVDIRPNAAVVQQDGPPVTTHMGQRYDISEGWCGVVLWGGGDELEYHGE